MKSAGTHSHWMPEAAPRAGLRALDWHEAQAAVNFVLFRPDPLPDGFRIERPTVRPEIAPARGKGAAPWTIACRAAHRCELVGDGLRVRIKQFLYDWAPPAWDHPALAGHDARPFVVGGHVGWVGRDFRGFEAATVTLDRTTVELSVREGDGGEALLVALCHVLRPVSEEAREQILHTPFGELAYRSRHPDRTMEVPIGFWRHRRGPADVPVRTYTADTVPADLPGRHIAPPARLNYRLDTVLAFGDPAAPQEVEYLYADVADPGRTIRLIVSPAGTPYGLSWPPAPEGGTPCAAERFDLDGREVHYAYTDPRYGPHEAVWHAGGLNLMLLVKPAPWTDRFWFQSVLADMVRID